MIGRDWSSEEWTPILLACCAAVGLVVAGTVFGAIVGAAGGLGRESRASRARWAVLLRATVGGVLGGGLGCLVVLFLGRYVY